VGPAPPGRALGPARAWTRGTGDDRGGSGGGGGGGVAHGPPAAVEARQQPAASARERSAAAAAHAAAMLQARPRPPAVTAGALTFGKDGKVRAVRQGGRTSAGMGPDGPRQTGPGRTTLGGRRSLTG